MYHQTHTKRFSSHYWLPVYFLNMFEQERHVLLLLNKILVWSVFCFFPTVAFICLMAGWKQLWVTQGLKIWTGRTHCEQTCCRSNENKEDKYTVIQSLLMWLRRNKKKLESFYQKLSCLCCTLMMKLGSLETFSSLCFVFVWYFLLLLFVWVSFLKHI